MQKTTFVLSLTCFLLLLGPSAVLAGGNPAMCDTKRCYSNMDEATKQRVLSGETIVTTQNDPASPFEMVYITMRVKGADPQLLAGILATSEEQSKNIESVKSATVVRKSGMTVVVKYELDVKRLLGPDAGGLASKAPESRYAVVNHYSPPTEGSYLVWWEIDAAETAKLNPSKGFLSTANLGEPAHISGFLLAEPVEGTKDSVVTYANYVIPKSKLARAASGTLNSTQRSVLKAFLGRIARWAESVAAGGDAASAPYRQRICELVLTQKSI